MLANGIKQAATGGTGNITLAVSGAFPPLSAKFSSGANGDAVAYAIIRDSDGVGVEWGIGHLSSVDTFVRDKVKVTWNGAVYNDTTATATNLTTSGPYTLIVTPHAATIGAVPIMDGVSSGVTRMLTSGNRAMLMTTGIWTMNRLHYVPFLLPYGGILTSMTINVTGAQPSMVGRAGLYGSGPNGYMGDLIASAGDFDCSTTGVKTLSVTQPVFLPPGQYFSALLTTGGASNASGGIYPTTNAAPWLSNPLGYQAGGTSLIDGRYETLAAGSQLPIVPNPATTAYVIGSATSPAIYMGIE